MTQQTGGTAPATTNAPQEKPHPIIDIMLPAILAGVEVALTRHGTFEREEADALIGGLAAILARLFR